MLAIRCLAPLAPLAALLTTTRGRPVGTLDITNHEFNGAELSRDSQWSRLQQPFGVAATHSVLGLDEPLPPSEPQKKKHAIDRNFRDYPTLFNSPQLERDLWLAGDVHGDYFRYTALLEANGLIAPVGDENVTNPFAPLSPACNTTPTFRWAGKDATLVQTGDIIDKGYWNTHLVHLHMNLQVQAQEANGRFFMTLGNHEVSFLKEPVNAKTTGPGGLAIELWGCGVKPEEFASTNHPMGRYLQRLPIAVRIGPVFAAHGGQTSSRSLNGMFILWKEGLLRDGWSTITLNGLNSILRARDFAGRDGHQGPELVQALDPDVRHPVRHIVHAHNPEVGKPGQITTYGLDDEHIPTLIDIDVGMTRLENYSKGWLLHLFPKGDEIVAEACDHEARCHTLWKEKANGLTGV